MKKQEKIEMSRKFECEENGFAIHGEEWKTKNVGGYTHYWIPGRKRETFFMTHTASNGINVFDGDNSLIGNTEIYGGRTNANIQRISANRF